MSKPTETPLWRRPKVLAAAGFLAVLLVLAGVVAVRGPGEPPASAAAPTPPAATTPAARPAGSCPDPDVDQTILVAAPPATAWELVGSVAAPTDPTVGPAARTAEGVRTCYAHAPIGALYAAVGFLAALSDTERLAPAIRQLTTDNTGQEFLLTQLATNPRSVIGDRTRFQVAGFTFSRYTADSSTVLLAIRSGGGLAAVPVDVEWSDGDWKVRLPPSGNVAATASPIGQDGNGIPGFAEWAGA